MKKIISALFILFLFSFTAYSKDINLTSVSICGTSNLYTNGSMLHICINTQSDVGTNFHSTIPKNTKTMAC